MTTKRGHQGVHQGLRAAQPSLDEQRHLTDREIDALAERIVAKARLHPPQDTYLPLRALAACSGLSVRKLRDLLAHPAHPLPHYRVDGKILVRRSDFDGWVAAYRRQGRADVDGIVRDVLTGLSN